MTNRIDLENLLRLRVIIARYGEMDVAKWWNTKGQLSRLGTVALSRGFPRTHYFAQARSVLAVAAHRCAEIFDPPGCVTLWRLPEGVEEEFDARWEGWLDNASDWNEFFARVETLTWGDLPTILRQFDTVTQADLEAYGKLRASSEGRSVQLPGTFSYSSSDIALLALGFGRCEKSALVVPYARKAE